MGVSMYETIILAVACLSAPLFAKYAGYEIHKKPYDMVGVGGLFFLLAAAFSLGPLKVDFMRNIAITGMVASHVLGWLMVIIGAFRATIDVLMEKDVEIGSEAESHSHAHSHQKVRKIQIH